MAKNDNDDFIEVISEDKEGNEVKVFVKSPTQKPIENLRLSITKPFVQLLKAEQF